MPAQPTFRVALYGDAILTNPKWNKGSAFTTAERKAFGLTGRLPYRVNTLDEQCDRAYDQLQSRESPLRKNSFLQSLKDQNYVLYYALISRHLEELIPIIYTPTEAEAISNYSHLFRRSEGLYLTFPHQASMEEDFLEQIKGREIDLVVCSDAEQILGIGDQGVGADRLRKVSNSLIAGVNPSRTLSITLDVGTDNEELLNDRLYVGWPHKRVRGEDYDRFIDKFVQLVRQYLPHSLLHFEDFGVNNAKRLLDLYQDKHAVFNDDVQGTGAVTLATLMSAVGVTKSKLSDQRIVVFGAGTAGLGITRQVRDAMVTLDGLSPSDANKRFYLLDQCGLVKASLGRDQIRAGLEDFVRPDAEWADAQTDARGEVGLLEVVRRVRPTVLVGCSTVAGAFGEDVVREMARGTARPIILPLSNPSRLHECTPQDANDWTDGRALLATGSPFPPCKMPNGKDYICSPTTDALIYPGLGFGAIVSSSRALTDTMIIAGTQRLASLAPALKDPDDALLPDFGSAPAVNFEVAVAVAEQAIKEGTAGVDWKVEEVREKVRDRQWRPIYGEYVYDPQGER
ncbi:hypothetical protein IEO21_02280 [Rhodonia placenta]|uniref:Malic enzyme n=1 Tax=Rhodonia placenta TaxID=104341 RepID=A0A8H7P7X7_9APHY|nr:hypothetical protein IEO21_02280 [Postia placenta]